MKQAISLLFILSLLSSCVKDFDFDYDDVETQVVVNALFTEDEAWNVLLTFSKGVEDSSDVFVENATVSISLNGKETYLDYSGNGEYTSEDSPESGLIYSLKVDVPGYEIITASSSIPVKPDCYIENFDTTFIQYFFSGGLVDYSVMPLSVNLNNTKAAYFIMDFEGYQIDYGYFITDESISNLRDNGYPEELLAVLDSLVGSYFSNYRFVVDYLEPYKEEYSSYIDYKWDAIDEIIYGKIEEEYDPDHFYSISTFSASAWLENISTYDLAILGENSDYTHADIYIGDQNLYSHFYSEKPLYTEYWLRIRTCSREFYEYYESYATQVSQRYSSYSDVVVLDSNIENGYGIFAGYNQQRIHFFDW